MDVRKEARIDAREYARAQMYYGEGAGNRRKLISTAVAAKVERKPGYQLAFERELRRQDMAAHASKAQKERRRNDVLHAINKNTKAAATGNYTGLNMAVLVLGAGAYWAHHTGNDRKALEYAKKKAAEFRSWRDKHNLFVLH